MIPERTKYSIDRYANERIPTGDFLYAVLTNNLFDAIFRAYDENLANLIDICRYVYNEIPAVSWGSPERVSDWLKGVTERKD